MSGPLREACGRFVPETAECGKYVHSRGSGGVWAEELCGAVPVVAKAERGYRCERHAKGCEPLVREVTS